MAHTLRTLVATVLLVAPATGEAVLYSVKKLPTVAGATFSKPAGMNASGQVVGQAPNGSAQNVAVVWSADGNNATYLSGTGLLAGSTSSTARAINNNGVVVGVATSAGGQRRAFVSTVTGPFSDLGTLGGDRADAYAVQPTGSSPIIVGVSNLTPGGNLFAFRYDTTMHEILQPEPSAAFSNATGINDTGQITGNYQSGQLTAFIWDPVNGRHDIFSGPYPTYAGAINASGNVVGMDSFYLLGTGFVSQANRWAGMLISLGALKIADDSIASGINGAGQVVGVSGFGAGIIDYSPGQHGFLSNGSWGGMEDLNALIVPGSGFEITSGVAINGAHQIAARGKDGSGQLFALLLSVCGNGTKEPGEDCDPPNAACCNARCKLAGPADPPCRASGSDARCDPAVHCDGTSLTCPASPNTDGVGCDNSTPCDGHETCVSHQCVAGTPPSCGDTDACTLDSCNGDFGGCVHNGVASPSGSWFVTVTFGAMDIHCFVGITTAGTAGTLDGTCDVSVPLHATGTIMPDGSFTLATPGACAGMPGTITGSIDSRFTTISNGNVDCSSAGLGQFPYTGCRDVNTNKVCDASEPTNPFCPSQPVGNFCTTNGCDLPPGCTQGALPNGTPCTDGNPCHDLTTCSTGSCPAGTPIAGCTPGTASVAIIGPAGGTVTTGDGVSVSIPPNALPQPTPVLVAGTTASSSVQLGAGNRVVKTVKLEDGGVPLAAGAKATISIPWTETDTTAANSMVVTSASPAPRENQLQIWHNNAPIVTDPTNCTSTSGLWPKCAQCFDTPGQPTLSPYLAENHVCTNDVTKFCVVNNDCPSGTCGAAQACDAACSGLDCCCDRAQNKWTFETTSFSDFVMAAACRKVNPRQLTVDRVGIPGQGTLVFTGRSRLSGPPFPVVDPLVNGIQVRFNDASGPAFDVAIPGGAFDPVSQTGWSSPAAGSWTYVNQSSDPPAGIYRVVIDQPAAHPGRVKFRVKGKNALYTMSTAVAPEIVLLPSSDCFVASFVGPPPAPTCSLSGTTLRCR